MMEKKVVRCLELLFSNHITGISVKVWWQTHVFTYHNEYPKVKNNREKLNTKFKDLSLEKSNDKNSLHLLENKTY